VKSCLNVRLRAHDFRQTGVGCTCIVETMPFATISAPSFMHVYWYPPSLVSSAMSSWSQKAETGLHMKMLTNVKMTVTSISRVHHQTSKNKVSLKTYQSRAQSKQS
jgi:hypothetical protein